MRTHITFILDRSGSMQSVKEPTISGFNLYLSEQQKLPDPATVLLAQFDTEDPFEILEDFVDIKNVKPLDAARYVPRGGTPLLDAIGKGINHTLQHINKFSPKKEVQIGDLSDPEDMKPELVMFVILTDGEENASREYKKDAIVKMIEEKQKENWKFVFLGANMDAVSEAQSYGIASGFAATFTTNGVQGPCGAQGVQGVMGTALNNMTSHYRGLSNGTYSNSLGSSSADYNFTDEDRKVSKDGY
jgi:hypothetical protein